MEDLVIDDLRQQLWLKISEGLHPYPLARNALQDIFRKWFGHPLFEDHLADGNRIIARLEKLWAAHPEKTKILYVVFYPLPNILRQSLALQRSGKYTTAIIGACNREELRLENFCDGHYECENPTILAYILQQVRADIVHAVTGPSHIACIAALFSHSPLVVEIYDSLIFLWEDFMQRPDYQLEAYALQQARGIQHKYTRQGHFRLKEHYRITVPLIQFHCFVTDAFFNPENRKNNTQYPHLVYTGGLMPPQRAMELGHTCLLFGEMIRAVVKQGIHLTIYANQNARDMRWHRQKLYYDLQEQFSTFTVRCGIPIDRIAMTAHRFHFGFFYDNLANLNYHPEHYQVATATKMYSYLEMGLPLLIYPQFEFIYNVAIRFGIGVAYDVHDLAKLRRILEKTDHQQLLRRVDSFRKTIRIKEFIPSLMAFHQMVLDGQKSTGAFDDFFPLETSH